MKNYVQNRLPLIIKILGIIYLLAPLLYYAFYSYNYFLYTRHIDFYNVINVISYPKSIYFTIQFIIIMFITPIVGIGLISRRKWGLILFFLFGTILLLTNIINYIMYPQMFSIGKLIINFFIILILLLFVRIELRAPFYRPDWKIREERYNHSIPIRYRVLTNNNFIEGTTEDISESGCFIASEIGHFVGEKLQLKLSHNEKEINLSGDIVWVSDGKRFKKGFGVMFNHRFL